MRCGRGGGKAIAWSLALCATWACGGAIQVQPDPIIPVTACTLIDTPSIGDDTATIRFAALGFSREHCALTLAAETLRPWPSSSRGPWTVLVAVTPVEATVRLLDGEAARNTIDAGAALMATDDLDLTTYAASRADLEVTPLPWDRTYLHLAHALSSLGTHVGPDAVRADARLSDAPPCEFQVMDETPRPTGTVSKRVVYDVGDRTARELAERIVALLETGDATAVGMSLAELDVALRAGSELAYVIAIPRASYCEALVTLARRGSWTGLHAARPLIDTRAHSIAPRAPRP